MGAGVLFGTECRVDISNMMILCRVLMKNIRIFQRRAFRCVGVSGRSCKGFEKHVQKSGTAFARAGWISEKASRQVLKNERKVADCCWPTIINFTG